MRSSLPRRSRRGGAAPAGCAVRDARVACPGNCQSGVETGDEEMLTTAESAARRSGARCQSLAGHPLWAAQASGRARVALARGDVEPALENARIALDERRSSQTRGSASRDPDPSRARHPAPQRRGREGGYGASCGTIQSLGAATDVRRGHPRALAPRAGGQRVAPSWPVRSRVAPAPRKQESGRVQRQRHAAAAPPDRGQDQCRDRRGAGVEESAVTSKLSGLYARIGAASRAEATAFAFRAASRTPMALSVTVDRPVCMGAGNCIAIAPTAFDWLAGDFAKAAVVDVDSVDEEVLREAALACPTLAINIEEVGEVLAWKLPPRRADEAARARRHSCSPTSSARPTSPSCSATKRGRRLLSWHDETLRGTVRDPPRRGGGGDRRRLLRRLRVARRRARLRRRHPEDAVARTARSMVSRRRCASAFTLPTRRRSARTTAARASTRRRESPASRTGRRSSPAATPSSRRVQGHVAAASRTQGAVTAGRSRRRGVAVARLRLPVDGEARVRPVAAVRPGPDGRVEVIAQT